MTEEARPGAFEWFDVLRIDGEKQTPDRTAVILEMALTIFLDRRKVVSIACTGNHIDELAVGFLYSEGMIRNVGDIDRIEIAADRASIHVFRTPGAQAGGASNFENTEAIASSGARSVAAGVNPPPFAGGEGAGPKLTAAQAAMLMARMIAGAVLHEKTHGTHCAALAVASGIIAVREDIGRHNALDMLAGYLLLNGIASADKIVVRTGRASQEIVGKAWNMGVPVVVSISTPTSAAVRMARQAGMTLIGSVRGDRMIIYADKGRVNH